MPFTFVHASDLLLGAPLFAVAELPDPLRKVMSAARFAAARRVFDLALAEGVDAVLLAGGVFGGSPEPAVVRFLSEQFERLNAAGIPVCWSERDSDLPRWVHRTLPENVFLMDSGAGQSYEFSTGDRPEAVVWMPGTRRPPRCRPDLPRVGIVPRAAGFVPPEECDVDYWALGGRSEPGMVSLECGTAQFSGTTQGASPAEKGPRGCALVRIEEGRLTSQFVPTAEIDWRDESLCIDQDSDWAGLRSAFTERVHDIFLSTTSQAVMVRWIVRGRGIVWQQLLREDANSQLLSELRCEFGGAAVPVWSLFVEPAPDATDADHRESTPGLREMLPTRAGSAIDVPHAGGEPHFGHRQRERTRRNGAGVATGG